MSRKGMSPNVIQFELNRAVGITQRTPLLLTFGLPFGDTADAHESPLLAVLRAYRPAATTWAPPQYRFDTAGHPGHSGCCLS
jgi:hypothetical protein